MSDKTERDPRDRPDSPLEPSAQAPEPGPVTAEPIQTAPDTPVRPRKIRITYHTPYFPGWNTIGANVARPSGIKPVEVLLFRAPKWTRAAVLFVLWVVILGTTLTVSGSDVEQTMAVAHEFVGVWATVAPKYDDNFFEITRERLSFGTGADGRVAYPISRASRRKDGEGFVYTLWHLVEDEDEIVEQPFRFYYNHDQRIIRLRNQRDIVWNHVGDPRDVRRLVREIEESSTQYEEQYGELSRTPEAQNGTDTPEADGGSSR